MPPLEPGEQFNPETGEIIGRREPQPQPPAAPRKPRKARKKANGRAPVPADESRRAKFVRLAKGRFERIVRAIHTMRSLGRNQAAYEYGDADIEVITDRLVAELEAMKNEMKRRGRPVQTSLDLQ
jgi:hypothetical protein